MVCIATDLEAKKETILISTLKEYKDVFAWSYKDLKGVDPQVCQLTIPLKADAKPRKQRPYTYNETFAKKSRKKLINSLRQILSMKLSTLNGYHLLWLCQKRMANSKYV